MLPRINYCKSCQMARLNYVNRMFLYYFIKKENFYVYYMIYRVYNTHPGGESMEKILLQQLKEGDTQALGELYNLYAEHALRTACAVTRSPSMAADAVQEAFIRVYDSIGSYDLSRPFQPWFYKILLNECRKTLKSSRKVVPMEDYLSETIENASRDPYLFEEYEELYHALSQLKELYRVPIILKYLNGMTEQEISDILDCNQNTIKSRLFKGRKKLRKLITSQGKESFL